MANVNHILPCGIHYACDPAVHNMSEHYKGEPAAWAGIFTYFTCPNCGRAFRTSAEHLYPCGKHYACEGPASDHQFYPCPW
jgi:hypothetical protein